MTCDVTPSPSQVFIAWSMPRDKATGVVRPREEMPRYHRKHHHHRRRRRRRHQILFPRVKLMMWQNGLPVCVSSCKSSGIRKADVSFSPVRSPVSSVHLRFGRLRFLFPDIMSCCIALCRPIESPWFFYRPTSAHVQGKPVSVVDIFLIAFM